MKIDYVQESEVRENETVIMLITQIHVKRVPMFIRHSTHGSLIENTCNHCAFKFYFSKKKFLNYVNRGFLYIFTNIFFKV